MNDAASLILFAPADAEAPDAPPRLLMIERGAALRFGGGALAFPGGRIDECDLTHALAIGMDADAAARIAAIRETVEETGIAIGLDPVPDPDVLARVRAGLRAGEGFAALLADTRLALAPGALTPFARWRPPEGVTRRFDTRFYVAAAAAATPPVADGGETAGAFWLSAADALAAIAAGERRALFPTVRLLERLALLDSHAAARDDAGARTETIVTARTETRDGQVWLCIPEGLGYPVTAAPMVGRE